MNSYTLENNSYRPWIAKLNKRKAQKGVESSIFEVAFSEIALLMMKPGLTAETKLIIDEEDKIFGVGSKHFKVHLGELIQKGNLCFSFDPISENYAPIKSEVDLSETDNPDGLDAKELKAKLLLAEAQKGLQYYVGWEKRKRAHQLYSKHDEPKETLYTNL